MLYPDKTIARLEPGTLKRIAAALRPEETQGEFIRFAVFALLKKREK